MAKKNISELLSQVTAAHSRLQAEAKLRGEDVKVGAPKPVGFVGKELVKSNASLDQRIADLESGAAQSEVQIRDLKFQLNEREAILELDPKRVAPSPLAIRVSKAFEDASFNGLCEDVLQTRCNTVPAAVRAYSGPEKGKFDFELIVGHRRRAACERVGVPFMAVVCDKDDDEVVRMMASENRNRRSESHYELGLHFKAILDRGIARTIRDVGELVSRPKSVVQRCLQAADLAPSVVAAFADPREIRLAWIDPLIRAWNERPHEVAASLRNLESRGHKAKPQEIFEAITRTNPAPVDKWHLDDKAVVEITSTSTGRTLKLAKRVPENVVEELIAVITSWHESALKGGLE